MKRLIGVCLAAGLLVSTSAMANADLAKSKNCMTCHSVASKVIGPAYKDVAAKYAGQNVEDKLVQKVLKGGGGAWGASSVMPANPQVTEAEARTLVKWILSLK
jgi:cytochrome c